MVMKSSKTLLTILSIVLTLPMIYLIVGSSQSSTSVSVGASLLEEEEVVVDLGNSLTVDEYITVDEFLTNLEDTEVSSDQDKIEYRSVGVCDITADFYSYMSYTSLSGSSRQGQFSYSSDAYTDNGIRYYKGYMMIAVANQYGPVGTTYEIEFSDGSVIYAIKSDEKAGTDCTHSAGSGRRSLVEVLVDPYYSSPSYNKGRYDGDLSELLFGEFGITVVDIRVGEVLEP